MLVSSIQIIPGCSAAGGIMLTEPRNGPSRRVAGNPLHSGTLCNAANMEHAQNLAKQTASAACETMELAPAYLHRPPTDRSVRLPPQSVHFSPHRYEPQWRPLYPVMQLRVMPVAFVVSLCCDRRHLQHGVSSDAALTRADRQILGLEHQCALEVPCDCGCCRPGPECCMRRAQQSARPCHSGILIIQRDSPAKQLACTLRPPAVCQMLTHALCCCGLCGKQARPCGCSDRPPRSLPCRKRSCVRAPPAMWL